MRIAKIQVKSISLFILFITNSLLLFSCKPQEGNNIDTEKSIPKTQTANQAIIDSSFKSFLSHFQEIKLPYQVNSIENNAESFEINFGFGMCFGEVISVDSLIKDYYIRNFLYKDTVSPIDIYLTRYQEIMKEESHWSDVKYGNKFQVNDSIIAIIYFAYHQVSATNGLTNLSILTTFNQHGIPIDWLKLAQQDLSLSMPNSDYDSLNSIWEKKVISITCDYQINSDLSIKIARKRMEGINRDILSVTDPKLLAKINDSSFTHQRSKPVYMKQKYQILPNGKIKKVSESGSKDFKKLFD